MSFRSTCTSTCALAVLLAAAVLATPLPAAAQTAQRLERAREERRSIEQRAAETAQELEDLAVAIDRTELERRSLEREVEALEEAAEESDAALAQIARESYRQQGGDPLVDLLESGTTGEAMERARVLSGVGRTDREAIEHAEAARGSLRQARSELAAVADELAEDRAEVAELAAELEVAFAEVSSREAELASRASRQRQIEAGGMDGVYACPLGAPYTFRDTWGAPRSGGRRHKGVDMFAAMGEAVYAITDGAVSRHSQSRLGGVGLYVRGDDGNEYYYAHLQSIRSGYGPGTRVEAGELIAANGDTGNARGGAPHVHFEVHPGGGAPVNPYPYAAAACF